MALTFPLDIADWPGTNVFDLLWRKEISRQASGATRVKDMGTPLWRATYTSREMKPSVLDYWYARLLSTDGGEKTFKGSPSFRSFPILYPNGSWPTGASFDGASAIVHTVGASNKSLKLDLLPVGYTLSVGDFISVNYSADKYQLFQVMEAATADGTGTTSEFEVRPHLPVGLAVNDVVSVKRPFCLMTIDQGTLAKSVNRVGRGEIAFEATQYI